MKGVFLIVSAATASYAADALGFEARKQETRWLLERHHYSAALEMASAINREWPDDITGYQLKSAAQLGLGNYQAAEETIQWMLDLRIGKADSSGWILVARLREATGDPNGALDAIHLAFGQLSQRQNRQAAELLAFAARIHQRAGRNDLAAQAARAALDRAPLLASARRIIKETSASRDLPPSTAKTADRQMADAEARLKRFPEDAAARDALAGAYLCKMRETADSSFLSRAQQLVAATLRAEPAHYEANRRQIEIDLQGHLFEKVISKSRKLISERPEDSTVWGLMGDAMMERGDYDNAAGAYQKMADLQPGIASYNRIAFYRFVTGDAEGAIEIMNQAVRLGAATPENLAWCLSDLGMMLLKVGRLAEAEDAFQAALESFPGFLHASAGMGYLLTARGQLEAAIQSFQQAQARAPYPEYAAALAKLYRRAGKTDATARQIALLDTSARIDQAGGQIANRNLALAFADLGHRKKDAVTIARAELNSRQDVYSWDALAWALFNNDEFVEAGNAIQNALAQKTQEPLFHWHAAKIFSSLGKTDLARQHASAGALCFDSFVSSLP